MLSPQERHLLAAILLVLLLGAVVKYFRSQVVVGDLPPGAAPSSIEETESVAQPRAD